MDLMYFLNSCWSAYFCNFEPRFWRSLEGCLPPQFVFLLAPWTLNLEPWTLNLEPQCNELHDGWRCELANIQSKHTKTCMCSSATEKHFEPDLLHPDVFADCVFLVKRLFLFLFFLGISPLVDMKFYQLCVFFASVALNCSAGLHWPTSRWSWWSSTSWSRSLSRSLSTSLSRSSSSLSDMDGGDDHHTTFTPLHSRHQHDQLFLLSATSA